MLMCRVCENKFATASELKIHFSSQHFNYMGTFMEEEPTYTSPFDYKAEVKRINERAKSISDTKTRKIVVEQGMKHLKFHADMLKRMSGFINAKNK